MTATQPTRTIVQLFLEAMAQRDLGNLTTLFADEVDWYIPGNKSLAPWLGKRTSKTEVEAFYELLWANTEPIAATVEQISVDGHEGIVVGSFSTLMLPTGKTVNSPFCIQLTVYGNLITKYRLLEDSYAVSVALTKE